MLFSELGLPEEILRAVSDMGFEEATEIQSKAIPVMLSGRDLVGRSNTGTGKTAAFGIPAIARMSREKRGVQVLILCPTRELAMQACGELRKFAAYMPWVRPCAVYGGASMELQIRDLKRGANIIVGTPGRVMDHMRRGTLSLSSLDIIILDEADEMLNMGFREDIETILAEVPEERQTALFSATMPPPIMAITKQFQHDPEVIKVESKARTVDGIEQSYFEVPMGRKTDALRLLLTAFEPALAMVFCNTKKMVDELTESLVSAGFKAAGLHGDMKQASRTQVLSAFKTGRINILIATDVAARGIDVEGVDMVFNYDLPQDNEYYIHRIGRTGRAGKSGKAYSIISGRKQFYELRDISKFIKTDIPRAELPDRSEIIAARTQRITEKISAAIESGNYAHLRCHVEKLCEAGYAAEDIAAALLGMRLGKDIRNIPEITGFSHREPPERGVRNRRGRTVRLEISAGRSSSLAPNFVLGALVEATGMPGRTFGKIDIYDRFTTVEVPEADREHIIDAMSGVKINGQRVTVRPYEGRGERFEDDRRRHSDRRPHSAAGFRPGKQGSRTKPRSTRPGYENRRKG